MRKITAGNKKIFSLFALVIILIIGIIIIGINIMLHLEKTEYEVEEGTILYDLDYNLIKLEQNGNIKKSWTGGYYLTIGNETNKTYNLGKQVVAYNSSQNKINVYGNSYQVFKDATVNKIENQNEIVETDEDQFYKLEDRKYLVVSNKIENETGVLKTKNYLLVVLDKAGNTILLNNELNTKTINQFIIQTNDFQFDIANERLIYNEEIIDLKKIIGSTNQYQEKDTKDEEENEVEQENQTVADTGNNTENQNGGSTNIYQNNSNIQESNINQNYNNTQNGYINQGNGNNNQNNNNTQNNNSNNNNNNNSQNNNSQNNNSQNNNNNQGNNNQNNNNKDEEEDKNQTELSKDISLRGINPQCSYMDVQYAIIDPQNRYQMVYLKIEGDKEQTIALSKSDTSYRVSNLTANTSYKVTLSYKEILNDGTTVERVEDVMYVRTKKVENELAITKIAGNRIYFNFKMDKTYIADTAIIALYIDGERVDDKNVNIQQATSNSGYIDNFEYTYGTTIELRLEKFIYEGKELSLDLSTKFINY